MTIRSRSLYLAVAGAAVALSAGCAKSGKVSGKVTQADGSPLPGGVITFVPEDSSRNPASATIKEDGTYEAGDVPTGKCKIMIDNRMAGQATTPVGVGGGYENTKGIVDPDAKDKGKSKGIGASIKGGKGGKDSTAPPVASKSGGDAIGAAREAAGAPKIGASVIVPGTAVKINSKYYTADNSGLSLDVAGGSNTFDVKLNAP